MSADVRRPGVVRLSAVAGMALGAVLFLPLGPAHADGGKPMPVSVGTAGGVPMPLGGKPTPLS